MSIKNPCKCNNKESWARRSRRSGAGMCVIPKTDLSAVYLNTHAISEDGVIDDESGNGNDAQLVESHCGTFDGATVATANNNPLHNTTNISGKIIYINGTDRIASKWNTEKEFSFNQVSNIRLDFYLSNGTVFEFTSITMQDIPIHTIEWEFNNGELTWIADGVSGNATLTFNTVNNGIDPLKFSYIGFTTTLMYFEYGTAIFNFSEGGLSDTLYNSGTAGGDAILTGATLEDFWGSTQDIYHYNFLDGFDEWVHATDGIIRVPIGANVTQVGYIFIVSHPAGKWHNDAESKIQLPGALSAIQDGTPLTSLTDNKFLDWENGKVRGFEFVTVGTSIVEEVANGTKVFSPDGDTAYYKDLKYNIEIGKTYRYYIKVEEVWVRSFAYIGGVFIHFFEVDIGTILTGSILATTATSNVEVGKYTAGTGCIISKIYVWEEGTVPLLSYREMETNFNDANQVSCNMKENQHKYLIAYNAEKDLAEKLKIQKCLNVKDSEFVLVNDEEVVLTDDDGLILVAE